MAMQMQSILVSPVASFANGSNYSRLSPSFVVSKRMMVRCSVEQGPNGSKPQPKVDSPPVVSSSSSKPYPTLSIPPPAPKPAPKVSTKFVDLFAFGGPAPERINGRLAMIGFVAAVAVELSSGTDLFGQISNGGAQWFVGTSVLLSVASLIPLFKGKKVEAKTEGLMNSNAEIWNGRLAMLGLVALAFTEYVKGGALI